MAQLKVTADKAQVEKIHKSYKEVISIDLEKGELMYKDLPIIFARAELLYNLSEEMKKIIGESAHGLMYRIGRPYGLTFYKLVEKDAELNRKKLSREDAFKGLCADNSAIGWGNVEIEDEGGRIIVTAPHGFPTSQGFLAHNQKSDTPADSYFLGYFEGFFSAMDKTRYRGNEVTCIAKGDKECKMVFEKI